MEYIQSFIRKMSPFNYLPDPLLVLSNVRSTNDNMVESTAEIVLSDCDKKIIKQVEYYFGDNNLGRDKFLQEQIKLDDGWVTLETMTKFNRLKQITEDCQLIAAALKKSGSGLLEISEDGTKIRRSLEKPLPQFSKQLMESMKARSVYAKGFPKDIQLDQLMEFFEKYGTVESIFMRKDGAKQFKGSCFVTFAAKEGAEAFIVEEGTKFSDDVEFVKFYKEDYFKNKYASHKKVSEEKKAQKKKDDRESLKDKIVHGAILRISDIPEGLKRDDVKEAFNETAKVEWVDIFEDQKMLKIRFSQTDDAKKVVEKMKTEGDKLVIKEKEVDFAVLEGEEEIDHWSEVFKSRAAHQNKGNNKSFGKRKGGRFGGPKAKKFRGKDD